MSAGSICPPALHSALRSVHQIQPIDGHAAGHLLLQLQQ